MVVVLALWTVRLCLDWLLLPLNNWVSLELLPLQFKLLLQLLVCHYLNLLEFLFQLRVDFDNAWEAGIIFLHLKSTAFRRLSVSRHGPRLIPHLLLDVLFASLSLLVVVQ